MIRILVAIYLVGALVVFGRLVADKVAFNSGAVTFTLGDTTGSETFAQSDSLSMDECRAILPAVEVG